MVAIAQTAGYKRIALAFGNDIGSQTFIQPAIAALKKAGMTLTTNQTLDLQGDHVPHRGGGDRRVPPGRDHDRGARVGRPDAVLSEIKQLNGGKMIPIIGTSAAISPAFFKSAAEAVGAAHVRQQLPRRQPGHRDQRPGLPGVLQGAARQQGKVPGATGNFTTYLSAPGGVHLYDGINLAALAMIKSKSTNPSVYGPDIIKIGNGVAGRDGRATPSPRAPPPSRRARRSGTRGRAARRASTASTTRPASSRWTPTPRRAVKVAGNLSRAAARTRPPRLRGLWPDAGRALPRLARLRPGHRLGAGDRRGRLHAPVRRDRRAEPRVRRRHDRGRVHRLRHQPGRPDSSGSAWRSRWRLRGRVRAAQRRRVRAVPAARRVADHHGDRVARDDPHHRVRRAGPRRRHQRLLHHGPGADRPRRRADADRRAAGASSG